MVCHVGWGWLRLFSVLGVGVACWFVWCFDVLLAIGWCVWCLRLRIGLIGGWVWGRLLLN